MFLATCSFNSCGEQSHWDSVHRNNIVENNPTRSPVQSNLCSDAVETIRVKAVGSSPLQSNLCCCTLVLSTVVGNKVTETVSTVNKPTQPLWLTLSTEARRPIRDGPSSHSDPPVVLCTAAGDCFVKDKDSCRDSWDSRRVFSGPHACQCMPSEEQRPVYLATGVAAVMPSSGFCLLSTLVTVQSGTKRCVVTGAVTVSTQLGCQLLASCCPGPVAWRDSRAVGLRWQLKSG